MGRWRAKLAILTPPPWRRPPRETDMAALFARVFRGEDGERALEYLWRLSIETIPDPDISEPRLRHLEGQRFAVRHITALIERGRSPDKGA